MAAVVQPTITVMDHDPQTAADITIELDNLQRLLSNILYNPASFAAMQGGTVKISMVDYVKAVNERQKVLRERLARVPYWVQHDLEGTL